MFCVKAIPRGHESAADEMHIITSCGQEEKIIPVCMDRGAQVHIHHFSQKEMLQ